MKKFAVYIVLTFFLSTLAAQEREKPVIGISCSYVGDNHSSLRKTYSESVRNAGGIPVIIPITDDESALRDAVSLLDGLILSGGEDVHPNYYNEDPIEELGEVNPTRDLYDLCLIRLAMEKDLPLLGICRGFQIINVAFGGTLYQDIPTQYNTSINHSQKVPSNIPTHSITLLPSSMIANVTGKQELETNTFHHQAIKEVAPDFRVTAWATDSIPEAIESTTGRPIWAVEFHPEGQAIHGDSTMLSFFNFLTDQANIYRQVYKK